MEFITTHWMELAGVAALAILLAERIARLTPTKKDDAAVQFVRRLAKVIGLDFPDIQRLDNK